MANGKQCARKKQMVEKRRNIYSAIFNVDADTTKRNCHDVYSHNNEKLSAWTQLVQLVQLVQRVQWRLLGLLFQSRRQLVA